MNEKKKSELSKNMSYILRHNPLQFGIVLNREGFCEFDELLFALVNQTKWKDTTPADIIDIVNSCDKQRYEIKNNLIRARYGHSSGSISYESKKPPAILYHGTSEGSKESIYKQGIKSMNRNYVHMSETSHFASLAGKRKGKLVLIEIKAEQAYEQGIKFYYAGNEVWLSDYIPNKYLK